ncbi:hypothetical protein Tco_0634345, partial [Tanacetum coccineum]
MIKSSNGETPFSLIYGTEAAILVEIGMPTLRTAEEALGINLDFWKKKESRQQSKKQKSKAKMEKYYNVK